MTFLRRTFVTLACALPLGALAYTIYAVVGAQTAESAASARRDDRIRSAAYGDPLCSEDWGPDGTFLVGETFRITTAAGVDIDYQVVSTAAVVASDDLRQPDPSRGGTLSLITCHPGASVTDAGKRVIVRARVRPR
jgi:hypothetical protein